MSAVGPNQQVEAYGVLFCRFPVCKQYAPLVHTFIVFRWVRALGAHLCCVPMGMHPWCAPLLCSGRWSGVSPHMTESPGVRGYKIAGNLISFDRLTSKKCYLKKGSYSIKFMLFFNFSHSLMLRCIIVPVQKIPALHRLE